MTNNTKIVIASVIGLVVGLVIGHYVVSSKVLGGTVENFPTQFVNGLKAGTSNQLTVDASGNLVTSGTVTPASISGWVTSTLSSLNVSGASVLHAVSATTLAPSGISTMATTSMTKMCIWNGTNWVNVTFSGVTPSYATSTTCL